MALEKFKPLLNHTWSAILMWIFLILSVVAIVWYVSYVKASKNKSSTGLSIGLIVTSILWGITVQLIFLTMKADIP